MMIDISIKCANSTDACYDIEGSQPAKPDEHESLLSLWRRKRDAEWFPHAHLNKIRRISLRPFSSVNPDDEHMFAGCLDAVNNKVSPFGLEAGAAPLPNPFVLLGLDYDTVKHF